MNTLKRCHVIAKTPCGTPEQPKGLTNSDFLKGYEQGRVPYWVCVRLPSLAMSTSAADAIVAVIKDRGYIVDYILEIHATSPHCLSAAWYLRIQLSIFQGHAPQLCNEARTTVSGLELMWQRKYGAGSAFSTTIRAGLDDGEIDTFGRLSLTCMHMPGFGAPYRRAYLVGNDIFGAHSIATLRT